MDCFVDGCHSTSAFNHGGFCAKHWNMLRAARQKQILDAIELLRRARKAAMESITPPDA